METALLLKRGPPHKMHCRPSSSGHEQSSHPTDLSLIIVGTRNQPLEIESSPEPVSTEIRVKDEDINHMSFDESATWLVLEEVLAGSSTLDQHLTAENGVSTTSRETGVTAEPGALRIKSESPTHGPRSSTLSGTNHVPTASNGLTFPPVVGPRIEKSTQNTPSARPIVPARTPISTSRLDRSTPSTAPVQPPRSFGCPMQSNIPTSSANSEYQRLLTETLREKRKGRRQRQRELHDKLAKVQKKSEQFYKEQQRKTDKYLKELKELADAEDAEEEMQKEEDEVQEDLYSDN